MNETIKKAIETLAARAVKSDTTPDAALKYTQAATNIANAGMTWLAMQKADSS